MNIVVNGTARSVAEGAVVADLLPGGPPGVAVAVNEVVVPRGEHGTTRLGEGDVVEVVTAVQGG